MDGKKFHMDAWLNGKCIACGFNSRPTERMWFADCCFDYSDSQIDDVQTALRAAGHDPRCNPRGNAPAPSKQEPPRKPMARVPVADAAGVLRMDGLADVRTLLTRLSDFLANLPSGSLDRARNLECMTLRREIANAIVPADKKRK